MVSLARMVRTCMSGQKGKVHLGPNVSSSAHHLGCVVNGSGVLWQQYEYYYYCGSDTVLWSSGVEKVFKWDLFEVCIQYRYE